MPQSYKLSVSGWATASLLDLLEKASRKGIQQEVRAAAKAILERLATDPAELGDPSYRLPALQWIMYNAVIPPLTVSYGVHEELPVVFIRDFTALSRYGLHD